MNRRLLSWCLLVLTALLPAAGHAENAQFDANHIPTTIALSTKGVVMNLRTDVNGNLLVANSSAASIGTVAQGASGASPWLTHDNRYDSLAYVYISSNVLVAPSSVTLTGIGTSWAVQVAGGKVAFNLNNGSTITLTGTQSFGSEFKYPYTNPTIYVTALDPGCTFQVFLDGGH